MFVPKCGLKLIIEAEDIVLNWNKQKQSTLIGHNGSPRLLVWFHPQIRWETTETPKKTPKGLISLPQFTLQNMTHYTTSLNS